LTIHDLILIEDMLESAERALRFFREGQQFNQLPEDEIFETAEFHGALHALSITGEAAAKTSPETREEFPDVPWRLASDLRNFLIHNYGHVRVEIVRRTLRNHIPELVEQLKSILEGQTP